MRLFKLISKRALICAHCAEEISAGDEYISVGGTDSEKEVLSGRLHVPCFIHLLNRLPPKQ